MPLLAPMPPRDTHEEHRSATPLELFFDLTFVVAIAQAGNSLHHGLVDGDAGDALLSFPLVFFAIWWAWMNFTWFASAYDNDDVAYRLTVFVLMTGVLILAAGVPRAFDDQDFGVITLGYVVMRLAMVGLWLRAAAEHPEGRRCALRYAFGIAVLQIGWVLRLALPEGAGLVAFFVLVALELSVPAWAEAVGRTACAPRQYGGPNAPRGRPGAAYPPRLTCRWPLGKKQKPRPGEHGRGIYCVLLRLEGHQQYRTHPF